LLLASSRPKVFYLIKLFFNQTKVIVFTIQRLFIVCRPLNRRFRSKKSAWNFLIFISLIALFVNSWTIFVFETQTQAAEDKMVCDVNKSLADFYFKAIFFYIFLVVLMPIVIVIISNFLIILRSKKNDLNRELLNAYTNNNLEDLPTNKQISRQSKSQHKINRQSKSQQQINRQSNAQQQINRQSNAQQQISRNFNQKISKTLFLISSVYVILNLPYLITWFVYYNQIVLKSNTKRAVKNYAFSAVQIAEILSVSF